MTILNILDKGKHQRFVGFKSNNFSSLTLKMTNDGWKHLRSKLCRISIHASRKIISLERRQEKINKLNIKKKKFVWSRTKNYLEENLLAGNIFIERDRQTDRQTVTDEDRDWLVDRWTKFIYDESHN